MDFVSGLPRSCGGSNEVWVIVDRLAISAHFLSMQTTFTLNRLASFYVKNIETIGYLYPSFPMEILTLLLDFGQVCKKL